MNKFKKYFIVYILLILSIVISGCGNKKDNKYDEFMNGFYDDYFQIVEKIDEANPKDVVKLMLCEDILEKLSSLKELLDGIKDEVSEDKENNYKKLSEWYEELVILSDKKYEDWWGVTVDERITVHNILLDTSIRLSKWNDKDSGVIWDK